MIKNPFKQRLMPSISARAELALKIFLTLVILLVMASSIERALFGTTDIDGFYEAGEYLREERELSTRSDIERYPPPFQAIMAFQSLLPMGLVATLWAILNVVLIADLPRRFAALSDIPAGRQWPAMLAMAPFLIDNMLLTQNGIFLLWLGTAGLAWIRKRSQVAGGFALGLAAFIKIFPAALFLVPLIRLRVIKPVIGGVLAALFSFGLLLFFVSPGHAWEGSIRWVTQLRGEHTPQEMIENERSLRYNNQALPITLARTFGDVGDIEIKGATQLASVPLPVIWTTHRVLVFAMLATVVIIAWIARGDESGRIWLGLYAMTAVLMLSVSPLVWTHYFVWLMPGLVYFSERRKWVIGAFFYLFLTLTSDPLRGLGAHIFFALVLFGVVAVDLMRRSHSAEAAISRETGTAERSPQPREASVGG